LEAGFSNNYLVAVVGAGPAGLFAARQLANQGVQVILFNRDVKPGGLAEYGIYYDKYKMKEGLRKQFRQIMQLPLIDYYGNVTVGQKGDLSIADLRALGFQAILVTAGAQGTKWLGLPGEDLHGVYHAKDLVYHYNQLPPFSVRKYAIGESVALIGVGNVMMDIAHWLVRDLKVKEVVAVARRGPAEVKFTKKEMEIIGANLDLPALDAEFKRVAPIMQSVGQDVAAAKNFILAAIPKALERISQTRFRFDFLASPARIVGGERGWVRGLEIEDTTLVAGDGEPQAKRLGTRRMLEVDTVVFCIGDKVDDNFGLPVRWNEFVKNPSPRFPVGGISYEAFDPDLDRPIDRVFVAGWSREASSGLVGVARKDGENGAAAVLEYLKTLQPSKEVEQLCTYLERRLAVSEKVIITKSDLNRLEAIEGAVREKQGLEDFKFSTNGEMFSALGLTK
jgi:ferredoxin--NADP+ reductase